MSWTTDDDLSSAEQAVGVLRRRENTSAAPSWRIESSRRCAIAGCCPIRRLAGEPLGGGAAESPLLREPCCLPRGCWSAGTRRRQRSRSARAWRGIR